MMRKRIPEASLAGPAAFGLIAWLEQTKITLPLKGVECEFNVCGDMAGVEMDQIFHQNNAQPLDCLYTFPLPASAAVYRCEMHVNGRLIRAKVEERERARQLAREKKAAGHRTALVEMERDNLFTLSLGNIQPGDLVVIRFAYFQTLNRLGDWTSLSIPFCPGIRYIPGTPLLRTARGRGVVDDTDQVPDASRVSPPRIERLHPDAAYLSVEGIVEDPLGDVKDLSSPSHPVFVRLGKGASRVTLADRAEVPDCDLILRWTEAQLEEVKPMGWVTKSGCEAFALVRLRAPAQVAASGTYSQDVYFLIDRSGSMAGLKWQKALEAFREFLKALGKEDRVWATFFESRVRDLAEKPLFAAEILSDSALRGLEALGTAGGTELLPALEHVLGKIAAHSTDRPVSLVLITDGQVGNEAPILTRLARHTRLGVHVFGVDAAINDGFLQKLAAQHHGSSCLLSPQDDIVGAVARLGAKLRRPVLTSIRVQDGWELASQELPDLHAGEGLSLPLKAQRVLPVPEAPLTLQGKLPDGTAKTYRFDLVETDAVAARLLWAKRRVEFLLAKGETKDAIALAKQSNLVCEGAAFIAWDEVEKVPVSGLDREVYQPAMMPRMRFARSFSVGAAAVAGEADFCSVPVNPLRMLHDSTVEPAGRSDRLEKLEKLCKRAAHPHWLPKCRAVVDWAWDESVGNVVLDERRRQLADLVRLLEDDAERIEALFKKVDRRLGGSGLSSGDAQKALGEIGDTLRNRSLDWQVRRLLLEDLERLTGALGLNEVSVLLAELASIEKQMTEAIDHFLLRYVERAKETDVTA